MAQKFIPDEASSYYPPRSRWYSSLFNVGNSLRRRLTLKRFRLPQTIRIGELLAGFLAPGLAVYLRGPRLWGQAALSACALLLLIYIVGLGYSAANLAFGFLISIHTSGFVYYCSPFLTNEPFRSRLGFTFLVLMAITGALYGPARNVIQEHWLTPLSVNGRVFVVQRAFSPTAIQRDDSVAYLTSGYYFSNHGGGGAFDRNIISLGSVLAVAGDRVEFSAKTFSVNGVSHPGLPHMPPKGIFLVPENHWFIWPNLAISGNWNAGEDNVAAAMLGLADVSETQLVGRPFHRWFGRKQILP